MLVIRLMRTGKKNQPFFRFVVTDKKNPSTAGRTTEILGFYNPLTKERKIDRERAKYWLSVGAKPSDTVFNFLVSEKVIDAKKIPQHKNPRFTENLVPFGDKKSKKEPVIAAPASPITAPAIPAIAETPAQAETPASTEATAEKPAE